jgi:hypothetical protein
MLGEGSASLKEMLGEAKALGLTMSSSAAKGVEDTVDSLTKLSGLFKGVTDQVVAAFAPALEAIVVRFTAFLQESIKAKGGVENFARAIAVDLLGGVQIALQAFEDLANGFISVYNTALKTKDALTNVFTKDEEKNARQLRQEIQKINESMQERGERLNAENAKRQYNYTLTKNQQRADAERLVILNGLLLKAEEANDELGLIAKKDFASKLNAEIQTIRDSLGQVTNAIPEFTAPAIESISDLRLGFKSWSDSLPSMQENMQNLTKQGLDGLTDSLAAGITGAADFADAMKAMAKSVVDSLIKMLIQKYIVDAAFGFITSSFGTGGTGSTGSGATSGGGLGMGQGYSNTAAIGGPVFQGERTLVGERGPEIFVPNANGSIIPNHKLGGDGVTINQTINVTTGVQQTVRAEIATLMPQIASAAKGAVADARQRGGGFSKALVGA